MAGGRRERLPGTLSREFRGRWAARKATWNAFAGIPWQVVGKKGYLERFCGETVPGGQRGDATWNAFAGIPWQVDGREGHLERFHGDSMAGGRRGDATWNTFAGIPCQVDRGEMPPGTLSREFRGRWSARKATWNAFAGIPWQVGGGKGYLEHFRGDSVPGGRQDGTPGTLSRGYRGRWAAGKATWNAFAGIPCQVGSGKGHLERFRGDSVAGGRREGTPGTLSRGFRARWAAGKDTWNAFAGIPWQVGGGMGHLAQPQQE